jgi:hypothetical protein
VLQKVAALFSRSTVERGGGKVTLPSPLGSSLLVCWIVLSSSVACNAELFTGGDLEKDKELKDCPTVKITAGRKMDVHLMMNKTSFHQNNAMMHGSNDYLGYE